MPRPSKNGPRGPIDDREREFIKNAWPALSAAEIARKLGRSRSCVSNHLALMRKSGEIAVDSSTEVRTAPARMSELDEADGTQDTLGRLRRLRSILERHLADAGPAQVGRIASEYRAVVDEIDEIENAEGGEDDELSGLVDALAKEVGG